MNDWRDFYPFALPSEEATKEDEPFAVELALGTSNLALKVIYPAKLVFVGGHHDEPTNQAGRIKPNKTKIESVVMEVARNASIDFTPTPHAASPLPTQPPAAPQLASQPPKLASTFNDRRCKIPTRDKIGSKRTARWHRLNKFHSRNIPAGRGGTGSEFDEMLNAQNGLPPGGGDNGNGGVVNAANGGDSGPPTNQTSNESPGSNPTDSPQVRNSPKDDFLTRPLSPKFVKESVEIWAGLKLPIDETGLKLKSDKCRPRLQLDGLEPEIVYRTANDTSPIERILFPEFRPRKRLKKSTVSEECDPVGIRRLPDELAFADEMEQSGNEETETQHSQPAVKPEPIDWEREDIKPPVITLGSQSVSEVKPFNPAMVNGISDPVLPKKPKFEEQDPYCHVLTPSPDSPMGSGKHVPRDAYHRTRYMPVKPSVVPTRLPKSPSDWPIDSTPTLTPPTPNDPHPVIPDDNYDLGNDSGKLKVKTIYESAEEHAQSGIYAPVRIPGPVPVSSHGSGIGNSGMFDDLPSYKPSWKEGSKSFLLKEQRNRNKQRTMMPLQTVNNNNSGGSQQQQQQQQPQQQQPPTPILRQPHTPGSHTGPRTPGHGGQPSTPGHGAPQTPGNPTTPGYPNPSTPGMGGPPSVGPHTPHGSFNPHTPGQLRQPLTPGQGSHRSPGQAVAPSPSMGKDFSAPKTPRTPRTPRSALTPGKGGPGSAGIKAVSNLPEASALLLSLILGDSVLDAHRDRNFVQAPLCICRNDVVGSDGHLLGE